MKTSYTDAFVITGATGAIGQEIAKALALTKKPVVLACRDIIKANELRRGIIAATGNDSIYARRLDLANPESIRQFATLMADDGFTVRALINNAGVMMRKYTTTPDGREMTFAVNYIGTLMLTALLRPLIVKEGHIIFTTSLTRKLHRVANIEIDERPDNFSQLGTYGRSKNALAHFSLFLAKLYPEIRINCVDPGVVNSKMITMDRWYDPIANIAFRPFIRSARIGAKPALKALLLKTSGNVVTNHFVRPLTYDPYAVGHGHLIEQTREYLSEMGVTI